MNSKKLRSDLINYWKYKQEGPLLDRRLNGVIMVINVTSFFLNLETKRQTSNVIEQV